MPYMGELRQAVAYNVVVDCGGITAKKTALTIIKINRRDKVQAAETYTVDPGARQTVTDTAGLRIDRVVLQIHPPQLSTAEVTVQQDLGGGNSSSFRLTCNADSDLVFDTIP